MPKKYRKVAKKYAMVNKGAHVVGHYADGARLIGLTDAQLFKKLKLLNQVNNEIKDKNERSSPYAKTFHLGLLRSMLRDKQRKCPAKPFALGGPRRRREKKSKRLIQHKELPIAMPKRSSVFERKTISIRIVGINTLRESSTKLPALLMRPSNLEYRRKSIHATVHQQEANRPVLHRPGWLHHRTQVTNVDIPIEPGWTLVPIDKLPELKLLCTEGTEKFYTRVACQKVAENLKLYRSLNTRQAPTIGLKASLTRCMVAYSAATTDNQVGKVSNPMLTRVFLKDQKLCQPKKSPSGMTRGYERMSQAHRNQLLSGIFSKTSTSKGWIGPPLME